MTGIFEGQRFSESLVRDQTYISFIGNFTLRMTIIIFIFTTIGAKIKLVVVYKPVIKELNLNLNLVFTFISVLG